MKKKSEPRLVTQDGQRGAVNMETNREGMALLQMETGQKVWAPVDLLEPRGDGSYYLPVDFRAVENQDISSQRDHQTILVVPVIQEELRVEKHRRQSGKVLINKHVDSREEVVDEPGYVEEVHVERVPVNKVLESPVSPYYEGDTLVIPLMEEVLVVEKRLVLREELRVKKLREEVRNPVKVTLRREHASVERFDDTGKEAG